MDVSLKIKEKREFNEYILVDTKTKREYKLILEFYFMDEPKIGDVLVLNEELLNINNENFVQPYAFEILTENEDFKWLNENDMAALVTKDKKYILKRIYG